MPRTCRATNILLAASRCWGIPGWIVMRLAWHRAGVVGRHGSWRPLAPAVRCIGETPTSPRTLWRMEGSLAVGAASGRIIAAPNCRHIKNSGCEMPET